MALLLGLADDDSTSDRTPWWLLLLRMLAVAAIIIGLAGPVLNPQAEAEEGSGPLLILLDGSWAGASGWDRQMAAVDAQLTRAGRAERTVGILSLTDPQVPTFQSADAWRSRLAGLSPAPWQPAPAEIARATEIMAALPAFDTLWFSDGLDYPGRDELLAALQSKGAVEVHQSAGNVIGIAPAVYQDGAIDLTLRRAAPGPERAAVVQAHGRDPAGNAATSPPPIRHSRRARPRPAPPSRCPPKCARGSPLSTSRASVPPGRAAWSMTGCAAAKSR